MSETTENREGRQRENPEVPHQRFTLRGFWNELPTPGRWLLSTTAVSTLGRGMTLPFTIIYVHEVRGVPLDVAGLLMGLIAVVALVVTGPVGALVDRLGARVVVIWGNVAQLVGGGGAGLRHHRARVRAGLHPARHQLRRGLARLQRPDGEHRLRPAAHPVLRHQLRAGQPRHRDRRHRQRVPHQRRPARHVHRDLPRRRGVRARADRPAPGPAAARGRAARPGPRRRGRAGRHRLPHHPAQPGRRVDHRPHVPVQLRGLRADGGRLPRVRAGRSARCRPAPSAWPSRRTPP